MADNTNDQGSSGVSSKGREIPAWLQNLKLAAPTKKYLTEQWLAGNFTVVDGPQDWGAITDVYEFFKYVVFTKKKENLYTNLSLDEVLQAQENASKDRAVLEQAIVASPDDNVQFKGKTYTFEEAATYIDRLKNISSDFGNAYDKRKPKPTGDISNNVLMAQNTLQQDLQTAKRLTEEAWSNLVQEITVSPTTSKPYKDRYQAALTNLGRAATRGGIKIAKTVTVTDTGLSRDPNAVPKAVAPAGKDMMTADAAERRSGVVGKTNVVAKVSPASADAAERASQLATSARLKEGKTLAVAKTQAITKNGAKITRTTYVDGSIVDTPTVATVPTGGAGGGGGGGKGGKAAKTPVAPAVDWEQALTKYDASKAWLLTDIDRTKYPQLFELLKTAANSGYYKSTEGIARFKNELAATDYYKELADSQQRKDIKKLVGDLGFDSTEFSKFVTSAINMGWEGDVLKAKTYEEVFRKNPDGQYANPTAVTRATKGNDYLAVSLIAKNYFNTASPSAVEKVLTGQIETADFQRQQREIAKTKYSHLSNLIDQGVTLEDIAAGYKQSAAKLLEIDPNSVDMSAGDFGMALAYGEEGKKRAMTTGEWEKMLRTDARFGWEKTENAKSEARSLATNLAQAFGRII